MVSRVFFITDSGSGEWGGAHLGERGGAELGAASAHHATGGRGHLGSAAAENLENFQWDLKMTHI